MRPKVSVIVPVRHASCSLKPLIDSLLAQTLKPCEVILACSSVDRELLDKLPKEVKVEIVEDDRGPNSARNAGLRIARGEVVSFVDSDCYVPPHWLENVILDMERFSADAVAGTVEALNRDNFIARYQCFSMFAPVPRYRRYKRLRKRLGLTLIVTANFSAKKDVLVKVGGFDEDFGTLGSDDMDLAERILKNGYTIICSPRALVYHVNREDLKAVIKRYFQYGKGFTIYRSKHPLTPFSILISLATYANVIGHAVAVWLLALLKPVLATIILLAPLVLITLYHVAMIAIDGNFEHLAYPPLDYLIAWASILGILSGDLTLLLSKLKRTLTP